MQTFCSRNWDRLNVVFAWTLVAEASRVDKRQIWISQFRKYSHVHVNTEQMRGLFSDQTDF